MGLRIGTNVASMATQRNLQASAQETAKSINRLSSGNRIVNAGDDAAGLALSKNLESEVRSMQQAQRNANDGVSFVQTAEGALNEVSNILIRLRELGVQAASDTVGDEERSFINKEFTALKNEIDRITNVTQFQGKKLINGEGNAVAIQVGSRKDENNQITYGTDEINSSVSSLGISGSNVESKDGALDSLEEVDSAISKVNNFRSSLGALQNRLQSASNNLGQHIEGVSEARSRVADTDIALEASKLAKSSILQSAGISVLAQANSAPSTALKLLQ